uniref:Uncharacterized protein n=1 Tax=Micrurus carvalhoi TaxID=3147026 RepID=A0A2H6NGP7_9SAUR
MLQDARTRGGFGLPNWEIYYQATVLTWMKEWITLRNRRLLMLEGHDLQLGWHAFLWYGRSKIHGYFQRHMVRNAVLLAWGKTREQHYMKIPVWLSTTETLIPPKYL